MGQFSSWMDKSYFKGDTMEWCPVSYRTFQEAFDYVYSWKKLNDPDSHGIGKHITYGMGDHPDGGVVYTDKFYDNGF